MKRYSSTSKGKQVAKRYRNSQKFREATARYYRSDKGKDYLTRKRGRQNRSIHAPEYLAWRTSCLLRDGKSFPYQVHHILPFSTPDGRFDHLRTDIRNGISLSQKFHEVVTIEGLAKWVPFFLSYMEKKFGYDVSDMREMYEDYMFVNWTG